MTACFSCHQHRVLWHFGSGMCKNQNFEMRKWPTSLSFSIFAIFFRLSFSPFLFFLLQWLTFYWACLQLKELLRKRHRDGQFLPWSSHVQWQEILLWVQLFHSTFWAFLCISQAPSGQSLWSGYYWKDLFLLQQLSIDDANFGQNWWRQKWKKGQGSNRSQRVNRTDWWHLFGCWGWPQSVRAFQ